MRRGDICFIDFEPVLGSEASKRRPAVIVSNDHANRSVEHFHRGVVTVVPLTSNIVRVLSFQVLLPASVTGLSRDSKAQAEQIRAVAIERVGPVVGRVPTSAMQSLDAAIRLHLQL